MSAPRPQPRPNPCTTCVHLFTTWHAERPRGCRAFGFETADWPSNVVARSSGQECNLWAPRPPRSAEPGPRRPPAGDGLYG